MDEQEARQIASEWHGGQWSPLYALASTGTVLKEVEDEILSCIEHPTTKESDRMDLRNLLAWVETQTPYVRPDDQTVSDFKVGDVVCHLFHGRYATVEKVGRKLLTVRLNVGGQQYKWLPTSVRKVS